MDKRKRMRKRRSAAPATELVSVAFLALLFGVIISSHYNRVKAKEVEAKDVVEIAEHVAASITLEYKKYNLPAKVNVETEIFEGKDSMEKENIEAELLEIGYYRDDVPLPYELQDCLHLACKEFDVDYYIMLALIEKETKFQNIVGDGGRSQGYCQIQKRWWAGLMDEIGAADLMNPEDNFRTACAIIANHTEKFGNAEYALTAYNSGSPGTSQYATKVLEFAERWREAG